MKKSELKNLISEVISEMSNETGLDHYDSMIEALRNPTIMTLRRKYAAVIGEDELNDLIAVVWATAKNKKVNSHYL